MTSSAMYTMPYLSADLAHALQVAGRRHEHAVGAHDGLDDDRRDGVRALEGDDLLEVRERALGLLLGAVGVERRTVRVRAEEVRDAAVARLVRPAARVARERDRRGGAAVVAAVHREHLAAAGDGARHPHRVLVRVGAAVREEHLVEVAGATSAMRRASSPRTSFASAGWIVARRPACSWIAATRSGCWWPRLRFTSCDEVEVRVALVVPERRALARGDGQRVDEGLRAPRVEHVAAVVGAHLRLGGGVGQRMARARAGRRATRSAMSVSVMRALVVARESQRLICDSLASGQREVTTFERV